MFIVKYWTKLAVDVDHITLLLTSNTYWILFHDALKYQMKQQDFFIQIFIPLALWTVELSWIKLMVDGSWGLAEIGKKNASVHSKKKDGTQVFMRLICPSMVQLISLGLNWSIIWQQLIDFSVPTIYYSELIILLNSNFQLKNRIKRQYFFLSQLNNTWGLW